MVFRRKNKEVVIRGFAVSFEPQQDSISGGNCNGKREDTPIYGRIDVAQAKVLLSPLQFLMTNCQNDGGARGFGIGFIRAADDGVQTGGAAVLAVGDEGSCTGQLFGSSNQRPGPCHCKCRITNSGQGGAPPATTNPAIDHSAGKNGSGQEGGSAADSFKVTYRYSDGNPVVNARVELRLRNGNKHEGELNGRGEYCFNDLTSEPVTVLIGDEPAQWNPREEKNPAYRSRFGEHDAKRLVSAVFALEPGMWDVLIEPAEEAAEWLWGLAEGEFKRDPGVSQIIASAVVTMIPGVGQIADARDFIAVSIRLGDERGRADKANWILLALVTVALIPVVGGAAKGLFQLLRKEGEVAYHEIASVLRFYGRGGARHFFQNPSWKNLERATLEIFGDLVERLERTLRNAESVAARLGWKEAVLSARLRELLRKLDEIRVAAMDRLPRTIHELKSEVEAIVSRGTDTMIEVAESDRELKAIAEVAEPVAKAGRIRPYNQTFRRAMLRRIWQEPNHPLEFLVDRSSKVPKWKNVAPFKRGLENEVGFEAGHVTSLWAKPSGERLMIQDPELNALAGFGERKGAIVEFEAVDIMGVPVDKGTAQVWERLAQDPNNRHIFGDFLERLGESVDDLPRVPGWAPGD